MPTTVTFMRRILGDGSSLQHEQVFPLRANNGVERQRAVEGDQTCLVLHRQGEQVHVGDVPGTEHAVPAQALGFEQAQAVGPERVAAVRGGARSDALAVAQCVDVVVGGDDARLGRKGLDPGHALLALAASARQRRCLPSERLTQQAWNRLPGRCALTPRQLLGRCYQVVVDVQRSPHARLP